MVEYMKNRYNFYLRIYRNVLVDYDEILLHYPDYYKKKIELEKLEFINKEEVDNYFNDNCKTSKLYNEFIKTTNPMVTRFIMEEHKNELYDCFKILFNSYKERATLMCDLIDYIGHYETCERKTEIDEILSNYEISPKYNSHDNYSKYQILADDIVRIIDKLENLLEGLNSLIEKANDFNTYLSIDYSKEEEIKIFENAMQEINDFPHSAYQKEEKSKVLEYKKDK